jgi:hypothetical protein
VTVDISLDSEDVDGAVEGTWTMLIRRGEGLLVDSNYMAATEI